MNTRRGPVPSSSTLNSRNAFITVRARELSRTNRGLPFLVFLRRTVPLSKSTRSQVSPNCSPWRMPVIRAISNSGRCWQWSYEGRAFDDVEGLTEYGRGQVENTRRRLELYADEFSSLA